MTASDDFPGGSVSARSVGGAWLLFFASLFLCFTVGVVVQVYSWIPGLLVTEVFLILLPSLVYIRLKGLPMRDALRWRPVSWAIAVRSVILGTSAWGMEMGIYLVLAPVVEAALGPDPSTGFWLKVAPRTFPELVVCLIVVAILSGLCEETLFRGALQGTFEKRGVGKGVAYTALLFAGFHVNPWGFLPIAVLGVLLGLVTIRTSSIVPAMICHASTNAIAVAYVYCKGPGGHTPYLLIAVLAGLSVVAFAEFWHHTRHAERRVSPLTTAPAELPRRFKGIAHSAAVAVVLLLILGFVGFRFFFRGYRMTTGDLAPEVNRDDRVLVLRNRYVDVDIQPGDVAAFKQEGSTYLRKVAQIDETDIWVLEKSSETEVTQSKVSRDAVIGKMVWKFSWNKRTWPHRDNKTVEDRR